MTPLNTDWTEERLTELKRLFDEGYSLNQMADLLAVTRNAVVGACHRKGWKRDLPPSEALTAVHRAKRIKKKQTLKESRKTSWGGRAQGIERRVARRAEEASDKTAREPFVDPVTEFDLATPIAQRKTLLELTSFTCRWPVGHPRDSDFFFCGAAASSFLGYCSHHEARAWAKPRRA